MGWRTVVITRHASVRSRSSNLIVQTDVETNTIPVSDIDILMIDSMQVMVSATAVIALNRVGAKIIFSGPTGQPEAEISSYQAAKRSGKLIRQQCNWEENRIQISWTKIVLQKIANQAAVLDYLKKDSSKLKEAMDEIEINDSTNREAVAARVYFSQLFGSKFKRSDMSGTNAILNYGYSVLLSLVNREIVSNGHLTEIGIHHDSLENYYNLGSDLMEPFRPIIDYWVATQNLSSLTPEVKIGLLNLLDLEISLDNSKVLLRNVVSVYVRNILSYLDSDTDEIKIEVNIPNEVSNHAINDHV